VLYRIAELLDVDVRDLLLEFDLDDGVALNYAKFEGAMAKI